MKKDLGYALLISLLGFALLFTGCNEKKKENDAIRIACNLPMTGSFSLYGESVYQGISLAMEDLKDSLSINNISLKFDFQDNAGEAKKAVSIYKSHEAKGYDIYISGITPQTSAILAQQQKTEKPHFIWSFNPLILLENDNLFRTWVDHPKEAEYFLKYLETKPEVKTIACLYPNAESAQDLFNKLFLPSASQKYQVVFSEAFDVTTSDFKNQILKIKSANPDIIFLNGWDSHLVQIIKELENNNMKKDGNLVFTFDLMDAKPKLPEKSMEGLIANVPEYEITKNKEKEDWQLKFKNKYGRMPNYTNAYGYDLAFILYDIAKRYKNDIEVNDFDIDRYIYDVTRNGITGQLKFAANGDLKGQYKVCIYNNGEFVPIIN